MPEDLLLEIGTEEIPARFMSPALAELKQLAAELLDKERLGFREIKTYGTPRRLVLYVYSLEEVQADIEEEVKALPQELLLTVKEIQQKPLKVLPATRGLM